MANGFNKVILMGNLTRDPELRATGGGQQVCSFSIAVNRTWKGADGERKEAVDFFECSAWGPRGETIERYFTKGKPILITGQLRTSSWEQDGQKRSKIEINVDEFNFIGGRGEDGGSSYSDGPSNYKSNADKSNTDAAKAASSKSKSAPALEVDDSPIDLSDIPF